MFSVKESKFSYIFEDDISINLIGVLNSEEAIKVWKESISPVAKHLYDLEDNNWIIESIWKPVGTWLPEIEPMNLDKLFNNICHWTNQEFLYLIQNSSQIVRLTPLSFNKYWEDLFILFDDSPLLFSQNDKHNAVLRFNTLGSILFTEK